MIFIMGRLSLMETHPHLASEAYGWDISETSRGSSVKRPWICPKFRHIYWTEPWNRVSGKGCHFCSMNKILSGFNDLATTHPNLASEADGWDPALTMSGRNERLPWKCPVGHSYKMEIIRRKNGGGCQYCAGQMILIGFNDLPTTHPNLASEADGWDPRTVMFGSRKRMPWICELGHKWSCNIYERRGGKCGCPFCSGHRIWVGFNDLATTHPHLISEVHGWDPTKISAGSACRMKWKCSLGHIWKAPVSMRTGQNTGCPNCASGGFSSAKPAYLYILLGIINSRLILKFGITNSLETRLRTHRGVGFVDDPKTLMFFQKGSHAFQLERQLIKLMTEYNVVSAWNQGYKFGGGTESFFLDDAPEEFCDRFSELTGTVL